MYGISSLKSSEFSSQNFSYWIDIQGDSGGPIVALVDGDEREAANLFVWGILLLGKWQGNRVELDVANLPLFSLFRRVENRDGDTCNSDTYTATDLRWTPAIGSQNLTPRWLCRAVNDFFFTTETEKRNLQP